LCVHNVSFFAQELTLKLQTIDSTAQSVLSQLSFQKVHNSPKTLFSEIDSIQKNLQQQGYFTATHTNTHKKENTYVAWFSLGKQTTSAAFIFSESLAEMLRQKESTTKVLEIPTTQIASFLKKTSDQLDQHGYSFAKVQLTDIHIRDNTLFATVTATQPKKRTIDRVLVKGYNDFPVSFVLNYLKTKDQPVFSSQKLRAIAEAIETIPFVSQIKPPEVLFKKDSTLLYVFLNKQSNNSIDGLLHFTSKESGKGIAVHGHIDLQLQNTLHKGETFSIHWKKEGNEQQDFTISTTIPYVFQSPISTEFSFGLFKKDSSFLSTRFDGKLHYAKNAKTKIGITYNYTNSESNEAPGNFASFHSNFIGLQYQITQPTHDVFFNNHFTSNLQVSFGKRTLTHTQVSNNQISAAATISYLWKIHQRHAFFLKSNTRILWTDTLVANELFRIGGFQDLRGFNEQSIAASRYTIATIEYRYQTNANAYFYTFSDLGRAQLFSKKQETFYSLGLGYTTLFKSSKITVGYALGKTSETSFSTKQAKVLLQLISFF